MRDLFKIVAAETELPEAASKGRDALALSFAFCSISGVGGSFALS